MIISKNEIKSYDFKKTDFLDKRKNVWMKILVFYSFFTICFSIDFFTKLFFIGKDNFNLKILTFFSLTYIKNTGASFGILKESNLILIFFGFFVKLFILYLVHFHIFKLERKKDLNKTKNEIYHKKHKKLFFLHDEIELIKNSKMGIFSLGLILAGTVGNLYDRIVRHFVVDFIHFHINGFSFPIFNFADTFIIIGFIILIVIISKEDITKFFLRTKSL